MSAELVSDEQLMLRYRDGDAAAFEELYGRHRGGVFRYVLRQVGLRSAAPAEKQIGTGHGRSQNAPARHVQFERESDYPVEVIAIHYDTYANLVARGVIREERNLPAPFPGGFVPDPPHQG